MNRDLEFNEWSTYVAGSRRKNSTASNICFLIWLKCITFSYDWRRRVCVSENMCTFIDRSLISSKCYCFCFKIVSFFAVELRRHRATDLFVMDWSKNQYQSLFWALHTVFLLCILLFFFSSSFHIVKYCLQLNLIQLLLSPLHMCSPFHVVIECSPCADRQHVVVFFRSMQFRWVNVVTNRFVQLYKQSHNTTES